MASPYFLSSNSLALTSPNAFFVTNDHLFTRRIPNLGDFLTFAESIFSLPFGYVLHVTLSPDTQPTINVLLPIPFVPFVDGILTTDHPSMPSPMQLIVMKSTDFPISSIVQNTTYAI
ncbi:hypothetical protein AX14_013927 [Amanita brunnescens Koide BX004]|nr:hypothetical protein AX14_013927 [Amanita brunnescens Koide BX004]